VGRRKPLYCYIAQYAKLMASAKRRGKQGRPWPEYGQKKKEEEEEEEKKKKGHCDRYSTITTTTTTTTTTATNGGTWRYSWLMDCATRRNVAGSIPDGVIDIIRPLNRNK
jgi:hypothetical protein